MGGGGQGRKEEEEGGYSKLLIKTSLDKVVKHSIDSCFLRILFRNFSKLKSVAGESRCKIILTFNTSKQDLQGLLRKVSIKCTIHLFLRNLVFRMNLPTLLV